eukprot:6401055-Prymnesium_polylepis.2
MALLRRSMALLCRPTRVCPVHRTLTFTVNTFATTAAKNAAHRSKYFPRSKIRPGDTGSRLNPSVSSTQLAHGLP